ncbi:MAG: decaprenyl-phosphate phosphoribosyltransferase [Chloroflexi bacterium]|nr:decaprenyl-phosphate phosphoribosyltransferase [Chloroflexota bacterium]MBS34098.1 decaprenyl-phosphate phosphoribosyltransferase [Verrucomicrobiales bacterium]HCU72642.1 decaprenyl-phosphate phosphoribosyltransferase [Chloroflexota bacterium]|tara:strand:+ start:764 stop:1639 length:876 start_codon:yes stop_codon:yes gene_type:complete
MRWFVAVFLVSTRPRQWSKNLVVLSALLFALEFRDGGSVLLAVGAMLLFTVISGGHYVLNDVIDVALDQQHPTKRHRPIAAGQLSRSIATGAAFFMILTSTVLGFVLAWPLGIALTSYVLLQVMYTRWLKHIVVLDLLAISVGFVLRAAGGALAISVAISPWLYICTFLLALFLAVSKRWAELAGQPSAQNSRPVLGTYTPDFLRTLIVITVTSTLISYTLYTFSAPNLPANHSMMLTVPIVLYGLLRYVYLVQVRGVGEAPERLLLEDRGILASSALWVLMSGAILQFAA